MPRTRCSRASSSTLGSAPRLVGGALGRGVRGLCLPGVRTGLGAGLGGGVLGRAFLGAFLGRAFLGGPGRPGLGPGLALLGALLGLLGGLALLGGGREALLLVRARL